MSAAPEQPPRAVDVPEAVLRAIDNASAAGVLLTAPDITAAQGTDWERFDAAFSAHRELLAAIATALHEAKEQGAADTARLDWIRDNFHDIWFYAHHAKPMWVIGDVAKAEDLRAALDAARAEPEPPVTREDGR